MAFHIQTDGPVLDILKSLGLYVAVGAAVPLAFCGVGCFGTWEEAIETALFGTLACLILWEGNGRLTHVLNKKWPWLDNPVKRFGWGVFVSMVFTNSAILLFTTSFFYVFYGIVPKNIQWLWPTMIYSTVVTALITLFLHSREFLFKWRDATQREEALKREQLNSQYLSLKNQLQPHFLFNSLSALTTLVHQDPAKATSFIQQLSSMYRYILEYSEEKVVPLAEELVFLRSYLFLMQIRFGNNLRVNIQVPEHSAWMVAPLTLQLLAENAIKHNEVSGAFPLEIELRIDEIDQKLRISNPIKLRQIPRESTGVGLSNIRARYQMISDREVEISQVDGTFTVTLPLLAFDNKNSTA